MHKHFIKLLLLSLMFQCHNNPFKVSSLTITPSSFISKSSATGIIKLRNEYNVIAKVSGILIDIFVNEGDTVKEGSILAKFDSSDFIRALSKSEIDLKSKHNLMNQMKAIYENSEKELERSRKIYAAKGMAFQGLEKQEFDLKIQSNRIEGLKIDIANSLLTIDEMKDALNKTTIRSQINGVVVASYAKKNFLFNKGSLLFGIGQLDSTYVELEIDEDDINNVKTGQTVEISLDANPGHFNYGIITKIFPKAIVTNNISKFIAEIDFSDNTNNWRPGMVIDARIHTNFINDVITIPITACIIEDNSGESISYVYIIENDIVKKRVVELGEENDIDVVIKNGLCKGDKIVKGDYSTIRKLKDGIRVVE